MFHDYITLLLANMSGGLLVLGLYLLFGAGKEDRRAWSAGFLMPGLVAFIVGLHMVLAWPIPRLDAEHDLQWANIAYGEMSVLLGVLLLGGALALAKGWSLAPLGAYALAASAAAAVVGAAIGNAGLSSDATFTAAGFFLTAGAGVLTALALTDLGGLLSRIIAAAFLVAASALWAFVAGMAYWGHLAKFSGQ
jgi:putative membrane protein